MPWWGRLIAYCVTLVCGTILLTAAVVIRAMVKLGREDEARHEELLREWRGLPVK